MIRRRVHRCGESRRADTKPGARAKGGGHILWVSMGEAKKMCKGGGVPGTWSFSFLRCRVSLSRSLVFGVCIGLASVAQSGNGGWWSRPWVHEFSVV